MENQANTNALAVTQEMEAVLPIAKQYASMFPTIANEEEDNRLMVNFALALRNVKTKTGSPAVLSCSRESIYRAGFDILNKKLDLSKNQTYLICYGNEIKLQDSYFGRVALVKKELGIEIRGTVLYEGDEIAISVEESGLRHIAVKTSWNNISKGKIIGAYATAIDKDGKLVDSDIMTYNEIYTSWLQSQMGISKVHKNFTHEACRKTVESRLAKHLYQKNISGDYSPNEDLDIPEGEETQDVQDKVNVVEFNEPTQTFEFQDTNTTIDASVEPTFINDDEDETSNEPFEDAPQMDIPQETQFVAPNVVQSFAQPSQQEEKVYYDANEILNQASGFECRVKYGVWTEHLKPSGQWSQVPKSWDATNKTVKVKKN